MIDFIYDADIDKSIYIILIKGTQIAIYEFFTYVHGLDSFNIDNYEGLRPLHQIIPYSQFMAWNNDASTESSPQDYLQYLVNRTGFNLHLNVSIQHLRYLGVESTTNIEYPHIWNLLNEQHADYVHNLFQTACTVKAGSYLI